MTEIQGKSILVRVSARFELARVRVIGSRLYSEVIQPVQIMPSVQNRSKTKRFVILCQTETWFRD